MGAESSDDFGSPLFAVGGEAFPAAERPDNAINKRLRGRPFNTSTGPATPSSAPGGHKVVVAGGGFLLSYLKAGSRQGIRDMGRRRVTAGS